MLIHAYGFVLATVIICTFTTASVGSTAHCFYSDSIICHIWGHNIIFRGITMIWTSPPPPPPQQSSSSLTLCHLRLLHILRAYMFAQRTYRAFVIFFFTIIHDLLLIYRDVFLKAYSVLNPFIVTRKMTNKSGRFEIIIIFSPFHEHAKGFLSKCTYRN